MKIVAVRKDSNGNLTDFKLDNNQEINYEQAIQMAKDGQIENIDVQDRKSGKKVIKSQRDDDLSNNLSNLPTF